MRILILSWYFPPINEIGAVRVGKLAEYLHDQGHEVWVVTSRREAEDQSLTLALPPERVIHTDWINLDYVSSPWEWFRKPKPKGTAAVAKPGAAASSAAAPVAKVVRPTTAEFGESLRGILGRNYMWLVRFPDRQGGWLPYLHRAASRLMKERKFDLIYASAPPFTTLVGAARLSRRFGVPWIAEYRDAWTQNHYTPKPAWRENLDELVENRTTRSASGIVAVSDPWTDHYVRRFHKPTIAIYNGFDPIQQTANPSNGTPGLPLTIVHMGTVYWGLRDPSLLFDAIKVAGVTPDEVQVAFYGATPGAVMPRAAAIGVEDFVKVPPRVPYQRALELQRLNDVLLLLQSPDDAANVPAKTFEYFAARRPILGLGLDNGIPATLVRERKAGLYVTEVNAVAEQLKAWIAQKRNGGIIPALPASAAEGLSRAEQFQRLEKFIGQILPSSANRKTNTEKPPVAIAARPLRRSSMSPRDCDAIVDFSAVKKPQLLVIVDAEEEFDWTQPFSAANRSVTTMKRQLLAHNIFSRHGLVPTYTVDYVVANEEEGYRPLLDLLRGGLCDIGAQLHPWVTPPQVEQVGEPNSFAGNLPEELEYLKLKTLTERIEANLGIRPKIYRAGRYGTGSNTPRILNMLGYTMDCSVLPRTARQKPFEPDYSDAPVTPYWVGGVPDLLEIPVTRCTIGAARHFESDLAPFVFSRSGERLRLPGIMARLRLLDRIRLSPEGMTLNEAKRLTRFLLAHGQKVFVVSYHTPSLGIGHTPYVRNEADLKTFLAWLEGYFEFFFGEVGGEASTPGNIRRIALGSGPALSDERGADEKIRATR